MSHGAPLHESSIPPGQWTLGALLETYPWVEWAEPQQMSLAEDASTLRYACRVCIANHGIKASAVPWLPADPQEVRDHIQAAHRP